MTKTAAASHFTPFASFAAVNPASLDTLFGHAGQALLGLEALVALNMQAAKTLLAETAEGARSALSAKSLDDLVKLQAAALQLLPQKATAYGRQVQAIFNAATEQQRAAAETQLAEVQAKFLETVDGNLKNMPGAENSLALAKSAIATANNAYDGVKKASRQVVEAVDANVTKFSETAVANVRGATAKAGA